MLIQRICVYCKHFRINPNAPNNLKLGLCDLFKQQDVVTGEITNKFANVARIIDCKDGKYFTKTCSSRTLN